MSSVVYIYHYSVAICCNLFVGLVFLSSLVSHNISFLTYEASEVEPVQAVIVVDKPVEPSN
jgi:hypothetical protein